ncbi:SWIM zinc finger family protein [Halomicroarcula sp. GCM10025324]|uniref:SWIM zinc finger family protein n=1 Tax=Haloarcula TaxID=2237 RepID=UPI0023E898E8|nr:SWIM zinc finger family protein [Halomicroarcula sp. ZS-22-S1]
MTLIEPTDDRGPTALAPDLRDMDDRAARAWAEPMAVRPREDDTYAVATASGHTYVVDLTDRTCTCPDHRIRGEHCKHLRRVAIEITARRVAPPGKQRARCDACDAVTFVPVDAVEPHLCPTCRLVPGDIVVVGVAAERADEWLVEAVGKTVAEFETNDGYPTDDIVVEATYLTDALRSDRPRRYSFPHSRLRRADDTALVD